MDGIRFPLAEFLLLPARPLVAGEVPELARYVRAVDQPLVIEGPFLRTYKIADGSAPEEIEYIRLDRILELTVNVFTDYRLNKMVKVAEHRAIRLFASYPPEEQQRVLDSIAATNL